MLNRVIQKENKVIVNRTLGTYKALASGLKRNMFCQTFHDADISDFKTSGKECCGFKSHYCLSFKN